MGQPFPFFSNSRCQPLIFQIKLDMQLQIWLWCVLQEDKLFFFAFYKEEKFCFIYCAGSQFCDCKPWAFYWRLSREASLGAIFTAKQKLQQNATKITFQTKGKNYGSLSWFPQYFYCWCLYTLACLMEVEIGTETGGDVNVELKSQWRPSQSRKESILNCLSVWKWSFIYKSKGGIGSENIGPLRRG